MGCMANRLQLCRNTWPAARYRRYITIEYSADLNDGNCNTVLQTMHLHLNTEKSIVQTNLPRLENCFGLHKSLKERKYPFANLPSFFFEGKRGKSFAPFIN
jgi:hypothetical protein